MAAANSANYESCEELTDFFQMLDTLFTHIQQSLYLRDPVDLEHCKQKLQLSLPIVTAIFFAVNNSVLNRTEIQLDDAGGASQRPSITWLLEELINGNRKRNR